MSPEQPFGQDELLIEMPSRTRIRQRLGQISTGRSFSEVLVPRIEQLGGQSLSPESFLATLAMGLSDFAEEHMVGITSLAYSHVPNIINALVDNPVKKEKTLDLWEAMVKEKKERDEAEIQQIRRRLSRPKDKLPRKLKKARQQSSQAQSSNAKRHGNY